MDQEIGDRRAGSSPRVWGTVARPGYHPGVLRFIPTCVGNGARSCSLFISTTVHPHVCGERTCDTVAMVDRTGSSPRVWGTGRNQETPGRRDRFIPTCVGNGTATASPDETPPVHPHVCGERSSASSIFSAASGSSPRVWGTADQEHTKGYQARFIPTCVGNGARTSPPLTARAVHPHVCGERDKMVQERQLEIGSSPRVWGTVLRREMRGISIRFIPTCVGNGVEPSGARRYRPVHPHVCGERIR